jgi:putative DNA-invertase from lambdoid prophage Rac
MKPLRAGLYARVSTAEQQTLPMQISAMREYADRRGWSVVASIEDVGSGAKDRPKRKELERLAKRRQLDVILVWRLDRWGRSLSDLTISLRDLLAIGVEFASVTEGLDLSTPTGRAMAGMLGVFAEFERDVLRERVLAGLAAAKKKGKTRRVTGHAARGSLDKYIHEDFEAIREATALIPRLPKAEGARIGERELTSARMERQN